VQSVTVIALINTLVFIVKASLFGLKLYYIIHIVFSISLFLLTLFLLTKKPYKEVMLAEKKLETVPLNTEYFFIVFGFKFATYKLEKAR